MNLTQLRTFHAVAQAGGFTAAARALGISQPAVTVQVRALEDAHRVELLVRGSRPVALTTLGKALYAVTEQLFGCAARAGELLAAATGQGGGTLRVGADNPYHLMPILGRFRAARPAVQVEVRFGNSAEIADHLDGFRIDVALVAQRPAQPELAAVEISRDPIVVIVPATHRWARRRTLRLAALDGVPVIRRETGSRTQERFDRACRDAGVAPRHDLELGSREAVREAVAHGLGIAVISRAELGGDPRLHPIAIAGVASASPVELEEYVVCARARAAAPLVAAFVAAAGPTRQTLRRGGGAGGGTLPELAGRPRSATPRRS